MKRKTFWIMLFIVALGTVLRLIFIDKPEGLWNDEYISWSIANIPLGRDFAKAVFAQCHMPFYYLYLKFFIHFFGNSDYMLRLTSVLTGVLSIFPMYFAGKELKNKNLGILCASITSLSSFLIYFSQEVRFYSLLFLFASLSLLFTIKLVKKQDLFNFVCYIISNFLIIFTHTIGFIFVFFNLLFTSRLLIKTNKNLKKSIIVTWCSLIILLVINMPLLFHIFMGRAVTQWWGHFTVSKSGFLITDYFSPILTNIVSAPDNFFYNFSILFIIFAIVPSIIAVAGIVKALQEPEINSNLPITLSLFYIFLAYTFVLIVMAITGKLMFITKYSIEIYPILIALMADGLLEFKKVPKYLLIFLFCFLNLFYILTSSHSAPKLHRPEGNKIVADLLKNANLQKDDFILLTYYPQNRFSKYMDFGNYHVTSVHKGNFAQYLGVDSKEDFKSPLNSVFERKLNAEILKKMHHAQKLSVVVLNSVSIYSPMQMYSIINNERAFKNAPFLFLVFSQIKNDIIKDCIAANLQILRLEQKGSWVVVTFIKN